MHCENKINEDKQGTSTSQNLENIMTINVTYGRNVSKPKDINIVAIGSIIATIKNGITPDGMNFMQHIAAIRTNRSKESVARIKSSLPWFCASELKDSRKATNLVEARLMVFDIDHVGTDEEIEALKQNAIAKIPVVLCAFRSPNDGVKLIVLLDSPISDVAIFKGVYDVIRVKIDMALGVCCDATQDPSRACFISFDPDLLINENVRAINVSEYMQQPATIEDKKKTSSPKPPKDTKDYENAYRAVQGLSVMPISYDEWISIGMALKTSFGERGKPLWDMFLHNPNFQNDQKEIDDKWNSFGSGGATTIGTLFHLAKNYSIDYQTALNNKKVDHDGHAKTNAINMLCTDDYISRLFFNDYGKDNLRYIPAKKAWYHWNKSHWLTDDTMGYIMLGKYLNLFKDCIMPGKITEKLSNHKTRAAVIKYMESSPDFLLTQSDFDKNRLLLAVKNGVIYHDGNEFVLGTDEETNREYYITKCLPVDFDAKADCPTWQQFLLDIFSGDTELIEWLQIFFGATLIGINKQDKLLIALGGGANGKTVFFNVMQALFGSYSCMINPMIFVENSFGSSQVFDPPGLENARLVIGNELKDNCRFSEDMLKRYVSEGNYSLHTKGRDPRNIPITWTICLTTNKMPNIDTKSDAAIRRLVIVPFLQKFTGSKANQHLLDNLLKELPGILNWLLQGAAAYLSIDCRLPDEPEATKIAFKSYETDTNPLLNFIAENCLVGAYNEIQFSLLYESYVKWHESNNEKYKPLSKPMLAKRLDGMVVDGTTLQKYRKTAEQHATYITGLCLNK